MRKKDSVSNIRKPHFQRYKHPESPQIINDLLIKKGHSYLVPNYNLPDAYFTHHHHNFKKLFETKNPETSRETIF